MQNVLSAQDVSVYYGKTKALKEVTFDISDNTVGLLGPNGAGKTTLIKALLNLVPPSSGHFLFKGENTSNLGAALREKIGYVPEKEGLRSGMTGVGWVAFLGEISGLPRRPAIERAHDVLQYVGLGESRYREVQTYSTGMQQRLKLAAALVHDPELVLLDEPTAGMDPGGRQEMLDLCQDLAKQGKTILLSTHILKDVEAICTQVIILHQGEVLSHLGIEDWSRSESRHYLVQWHGERELLFHALEDHGWGVNPSENGLLRVVIPPGKGLKDLFSLAGGLDGTIHRLVHERTTLEEVFLQALRKGT